MSSFRLRHARLDDAPATARLLIDYEVALYGHTTYTQPDLEAEWAELDLDRDVWVAEGEGAIAGYASLQDRGELFRGEATAPADDVRHALAGLLEDAARERGARRLQSGVFERDERAAVALTERGYRPVRVFRELRIDLVAPPAPPAWPDGLRATPFDPDRDARAFHAAHQEAFADHWEHNPRPFEDWWKQTSEWPKFDPSLWCVVRAGDEIVAGTVNAAGLYGGGWVNALFTRRPWRGRGIGGALLRHAFATFWERGERSVGLGVDAEGDTGAFRVYEREGMRPVLGWVMYEKALA